MLLGYKAQAQLTSITIEPEIYHATPIGAVDVIPAGAITYRIYANLSAETDYVSAVFGDATCALTVASTAPIFQSSLGGYSAEQINPLLFGNNPELEFDSFVTIGKLSSTDEGAAIYTLEDPASPWIDSFELGNELNINSENGGLWFVFNDPNSTNAIAGNDLKVLIAQITTTGELSGQGSVQVFLNGDPMNVEESACTIMQNVSVVGCTDELACNYDPLANLDDGSCELALEFYDCEGNCIADDDGDGVCDELEILGCTDPEACNYDEEATEDSGDCFSAEEFYDCEGNCLEDADGDGVCDELEVLGCTDPEACNYNPEATEDDAMCDYPEDFYNCEGECLTDTDGDGVCDELEVDGCTDPEACTYDELATEDDGSCVYDVEVDELVVDATCPDAADGAVTLLFGNTNGEVTILWNDGSNEETQTGLLPGSYAYTVIDEIGCETTGNALIGSPEPISINATITPPTCDYLAEGTISLEVLSGEEISFSWLNLENEESSELSGVTEGTYSVLCSDLNGCEAQFDFEVLAEGSDCLFIPNGFTPNSDGYNDNWNIQGWEDYPDMKVEVFNRWGQVLYSSRNGYETPWDGMYDGQRVAMASYYYIITLDAGAEPMTGYISIKY